MHRAASLSCPWPLSVSRDLPEGPSQELAFFWRASRVPCQEQESPTCAPDRPSKILLVQVWTLSSSPIRHAKYFFFLCVYI